MIFLYVEKNKIPVKIIEYIKKNKLDVKIKEIDITTRGFNPYSSGFSIYLMQPSPDLF